MINIFDLEYDSVIEGVVASGNITYGAAIEHLIPLINSTDFQRKLQDKRFYQKLERDIVKGCVMPPITVAFVTGDIDKSSGLEEIRGFVNDNISRSFVLDGIQRLNTLHRITQNQETKKILDENKKLYINFIFCADNDRLLYRMITLNNGQRPMTPRHQVEAIMANVNIVGDYNIVCYTEKDGSARKNEKAFNQSDFIQAYLAFMADSPLVDNKKIIQEKMDELIVGKIISSDPIDGQNKFTDVLQAISKFQDNPVALRWLKVTNNLIGFAVGMRHSAKYVLALSPDEFAESTKCFDEAFEIFNVSKIQLGKYRRELSCDFFKKFSKLKDLDGTELGSYFIESTADGE